MTLRNAKPLIWPTKGCSDTLDGTSSFKGAMTLLQNLIPDPTTDNFFIPRSASSSLTSFSPFTTPGMGSVLLVANGFAFGMIAAKIGATSGFDVPFMYNLATNSFVTISGVTTGNTPASPPTTGAWTPPAMDIVSTKVMVAHSGFSNGNGPIGWIDISNPAAPVWHSGNTTTNTLPGVPTWVRNFNNRAYFTITNQEWYSDSLNPTVMTNAGQAVTLGDTSPIVATGGIPFLSTTVGGFIQGMICFKNQIMYQITGDAALSNLAVSSIPYGVGTYAPNSLTPTPEGLGFVADDGLRIVNTAGIVSEPIGDHGKGITYPFINTLVPSRICACFNSDTVRISVINNLPVGGGSQNQEWWFDFTRKIWTGPHTFPASLIQPYMGTFVMFPVAVTGSLWQSNSIPLSSDVYTENGVGLTFIHQTVLLPDTEAMSLNTVIEHSIGINWGLSNSNATVTYLDQNNSVLDQVFLMPPGGLTVWGSFNWGGANWGTAQSGYTQRQCPIDKPIVFNQMAVQLIGSCVYGMKIGSQHLRYQKLGYMTDGYL